MENTVDLTLLEVEERLILGDDLVRIEGHRGLRDNLAHLRHNGIERDHERHLARERQHTLPLLKLGVQLAVNAHGDELRLCVRNRSREEVAGEVFQLADLLRRDRRLRLQDERLMSPRVPKSRRDLRRIDGLAALTRLEFSLGNQLGDQAFEYHQRPTIGLLLILVENDLHRVRDTNGGIEVDGRENLALGLGLQVDAGELRIHAQEARHVGFRKTRQSLDHAEVRIDLRCEVGEALRDAGRRIGRANRHLRAAHKNRRARNLIPDRHLDAPLDCALVRLA